MVGQWKQQKWRLPPRASRPHRSVPLDPAWLSGSRRVRSQPQEARVVEQSCGATNTALPTGRVTGIAAADRSEHVSAALRLAEQEEAEPRPRTHLAL